MPNDQSKYKKYQLPHYKNMVSDGEGGGDVMRIRATIEKIDKDMHEQDKAIEALRTENKRLKLEFEIAKDED